MANYSVNIGNINPKQKIQLNTIFIQMIGAQDMSYEYNLMEKYPSFHYKETKEDNESNKKKIYKTIKANFKLETRSKITRLIAPFLEDKAKKSNYKVNFSNEYKTAEIQYEKNDEETGSNKFKLYSSFCILFRTEKMNEAVLFYQYNPKSKENSYCINYVHNSKNLRHIPVSTEPEQNNKISYYLKYQNNTINESPGLFRFFNRSKWLNDR